MLENKEFNYNEPDIGSKILSKYGTKIMADHISGLTSGVEMQKVIEFRIHMAEAALQGDPVGIALSCFSKHEEPFNKNLPISISDIPEQAFVDFVVMVTKRMDSGLSQSVKQYLQDNKSEVKEKASQKNPYALWLMGAWYAFDDSKRNGKDASMKKRMYWYQEAAYEGYVPAMQAVAVLYDETNSSFSSDLKKSAFWYRHGALFADAFCAYNLGVMYAQGDFVEQNLNVAEMWLSVAYNNSTDASFSATIVELAKQNAIHLSNDPDMSKDPELNNITSEFQDAYESTEEKSENRKSSEITIKKDKINTGKSSKPLLEKSKNLMSIANAIMAKKTSGDLVKDESWMQRLWDWADKEEIEDLEWDEHENSWYGLPRSKDKLISLTELNIWGMGLTELPKELGNLTNLTKLNLSENALIVLPDELWNLTNITSLNLASNEFKELPAEIVKLTDLTSLDIGDNQFQERLPNEIWNLINLTSLVLSFNELKLLPKEIGELTNLENLDLKYNKLEALPKEMKNLTNLTSLDLSHNYELKEFSKEIKFLFSQLNIKGCKIRR